MAIILIPPLSRHTFAPVGTLCATRGVWGVRARESEKSSGFLTVLGDGLRSRGQVNSSILRVRPPMYRSVIFCHCQQRIDFVRSHTGVPRLGHNLFLVLWSCRH